MCQHQHHALWLRAMGENSVLIQLHKIHPAGLTIPGHGLFQAYSASDFSAGVRGRGNICTPVGRILWFLMRGQRGSASYPLDFKGFFAQTQFFGKMLMRGKSYRTLKRSSLRGPICLRFFCFCMEGISFSIIKNIKFCNFSYLLKSSQSFVKGFPDGRFGLYFFLKTSGLRSYFLRSS